MSNDLIDLLFFLNSFFCHQNPSRSPFIAGLQLPLCSRCTALNLGFAVGYTWIFYSVKRRRFYYNFNLTLALISPLAIDGLTQFLGFRESTNDIRILTGALAGAALANALGYIILRLKNIDYEETDLAECLFVNFLDVSIVYLFLKAIVVLGNVIAYYILAITLTVLAYLNNVFIPVSVVYLIVRHKLKHSTI